MSSRSYRARRRAFTLIELLVVIAIIALLIGILLPALGRARASAQVAKCLANCRSMGLVMTLYANDNKSWYPLVPTGDTKIRDIIDKQNIYGGVSGFFSLRQVGDGQATGTGGQTGGTAATYAGTSSSEAIMKGYIEGFGVLTCPADRQDHALVGANATTPRPYVPGSGTIYPPGGAVKLPKAPGNEEEVVNYNVSYMYIAGLKTDESNIVTPPPMWGDETDCYDIGTLSWYGGVDSGQFGTVGITDRGLYGKQDNHGVTGSTWAFADGHAEFLQNRFKITDKFFSTDTKTNPLSINLINKRRSELVRVTD